MSPALPHGERIDALDILGHRLHLVRPLDPEAILDALAEAPPDPDDKMPYWAELWASAVALAERIFSGALPLEGPVLELGCGLGLSSLAASMHGDASVTASDWDETALDYVAASAKANGVSVKTRKLDWRQPPKQAFGTLLLADLLYEKRNVRDLAHALPQLLGPGGSAWLSDPGRAELPAFLEAMADWSITESRHRLQSQVLPDSQGEILIYHLVRPV